MAEDANGSEKREKDTTRLEAFSDGVFAIAITLLALELKVPHLESGDGHVTPAAVASGRLNQRPGYFAFVASFFTVRVVWVHHHTVFSLGRSAKPPLPLAHAS